MSKIETKNEIFYRVLLRMVYIAGILAGIHIVFGVVTLYFIMVLQISGLEEHIYLVTERMFTVYGYLLDIFPLLLATGIMYVLMVPLKLGRNEDTRKEQQKNGS